MADNAPIDQQIEALIIQDELEKAQREDTPEKRIGDRVEAAVRAMGDRLVALIESESQALRAEIKKLRDDVEISRG